MNAKTPQRANQPQTPKAPPGDAREPLEKEIEGLEKQALSDYAKAVLNGHKQFLGDPVNAAREGNNQDPNIYAFLVSGKWTGETPFFDCCIASATCEALGGSKAFAASGLLAMQPQDAFEKMLCSQMLHTHTHLQTVSTRLMDSEDVKAIEVYERVYNKMARTFTAQMEALRKHRSGGNQTVTVQHVNVENGGQAIVGNVSKGGGK